MILPQGDNWAHWLLTWQISLTTKPNKIEDNQVVEDPWGNESVKVMTKHSMTAGVPGVPNTAMMVGVPGNVDELDKLSKDR